MSSGFLEGDVSVPVKKVSIGLLPTEWGCTRVGVTTFIYGNDHIYLKSSDLYAYTMKWMESYFKQYSGCKISLGIYYDGLSVPLLLAAVNAAQKFRRVQSIYVLHYLKNTGEYFKQGFVK